MTDQSKPLDAESIGQREDIGDQCVGRIVGDILRSIAVAVSAQVRHNQSQSVRKQRDHGPPRAVRFRKAMHQDHRRCRVLPGDCHMHANASRQGDPARLGHG